jgi:hypothetical protein
MISDEYRLKTEVETLKVEKNSWESLREEVNALKDLNKARTFLSLTSRSFFGVLSRSARVLTLEANALG